MSCPKVPTGGGKTFLAANAIEPIFHALGVMQQRVVVWLVPSDASPRPFLPLQWNPAHPYRQKLMWRSTAGWRSTPKTSYCLPHGSTPLPSPSSFLFWCCPTIPSGAKRAAQGTAGEQQSGTVGAGSGHSHPSGGGCRPHRPAANHQPASPGGDRGRKPSCPQHSEQADAPGLQPSLCAGLDCHPYQGKQPDLYCGCHSSASGEYGQAAGIS